MRAAAVETLMTKGRFEPSVAVAVAEAMDVTLQNAEPVTVPILDARLQGVRAEMNAGFQGLRAEVNERFQETNTRFAEVHGRIDLLEERMKRQELRLMLFTAAIVFANSHLGEVVTFIANVLRTLPK